MLQMLHQPRLPLTPTTAPMTTNTDGSSNNNLSLSADNVGTSFQKVRCSIEKLIEQHDMNQPDETQLIKKYNHTLKAMLAQIDYSTMTCGNTA